MRTSNSLSRPFAPVGSFNTGRPLCEIIIPIWNQRERTRTCLESILRNTEVPFRLILIDNGSEPQTRDFLRDFQEHTPCPTLLLRNEENLGNIKAVNQGIRVSEADYVCILDNDTLVFPGWLERMIKAAKARREIGIVNPGSNSLGFHKPWYLSWFSFAQKVGRKEAGRAVEIATATGFCMLIKRAVIERIGGWSEDYGMGYYEDTDYCRRAAQAGFVSVHARDAFVYHEEHASFRRIKRVKEKIAAANRVLFENRFGKPARIAFCLEASNKDLSEWVAEEAFRLAQAYNWIWIFQKKNSSFTCSGEHGNIKTLNLTVPFFTWNCLFRILKRKKRFDRIVSDSPKLLRRLKWLKPFHRAQLELLQA